MRVSYGKKLVGLFATLTLVILAILLLHLAESPAPFPSVSTVQIERLSEQEAVAQSELQPSASKKGSVGGTVRFKATGKPASNVVVTALEHRLKGSQTHTDSEGRYSFTDLAPGVTYTIDVSTALGAYVSLECPRVTIDADRTITGVDIFLSKGGAISGRVFFRTPGNKPLANARVTARLTKPLGSILRETTSASDGTYTLGPLQYGRYRIDCHLSEDHVALVAGSSGKRSRSISLLPGGHIRDVEFCFYPGFSISGSMTGPTGSVPGATVSAVLRRPQGSRFAPVKTRTDDDGAYVLSGFVSTSIAHVTASAEGRQSLTREVWVRGTDITGIDFDLNSEASIAGEVMDETGKALIGALVLMDFITPAEDWLEHHPRGFVAPGGAEARADDDGHFDTRGLTAGEYAFRVALAGRDKWVSVASTTPPVKVGAGQRLTDIVVVVPDIGKNFVAGRVVDPKGVPVPGVEVCAGNFHDRPYDRTDTDELDRYRLAGLGEGPVLVWFRHETLTRGANLYLVDVPIGTGDADIVIGHEPGSVAGIVVDAKTRVPLEGAEVEIAALQPDGASHFTRHPYPFEVTVQKGPGPGQFVLDNVVPGLVTLRGKAPGYTPDESVQAVVASGRTTTVTIPVETWSLLEGCVTCNGRPDARVTAVHTQSVEPRRGYIPASVDEQGHYLREELLPGTYDVWIRVPTAAGDEVEFRKTVEVVPGQVFQVDFHIPPS